MSATRWNKKQFSCFQVVGWEVGSSEKLGPWAYGEFPMESTYHPLYNSGFTRHIHSGGKLLNVSGKIWFSVSLEY